MNQTAEDNDDEMGVDVRKADETEDKEEPENEEEMVEESSRSKKQKMKQKIMEKVCTECINNKLCLMFPK